jgi:hypothetical protein
LLAYLRAIVCLERHKEREREKERHTHTHTRINALDLDGQPLGFVLRERAHTHEKEWFRVQASARFIWPRDMHKHEAEC